MIDVCALSELEEGVPFVAEVGGRELVLARWRDEVYAVRNVCPHQTQSFVCGTVRPRLGACGPGDVYADEDDPVIRCPWHTWGFSLVDGMCTTDPKLRVRTYRVVVADDRVLVDPGSTAEPEAA